MNSSIRAMVLAVLVLLGSNVQAIAEEQTPQPAVTAEVVTIHSKILGEDRNIIIYDPEKFGSNHLPSYPVLYMLDENDFNMVSGTVRYLSAYSPRMSPMLVVGIDGGSTRMRDLTPNHSLIDYLGRTDTNPNSGLKDSGGGERFALFMRDEVMPYIKAHYRTGVFNMLAGHSVGGLETIYCLNEHPEMFDAYFAISPALWWDKGSLISRTEAKLSALPARNKLLFLADSPEDGPFTTYIAKFDEVMKTRPKSLTYQHTFYPTENHGTIVAKAYYDAIRFAYPDWDVGDDSVSAKRIEGHFAKIGQRLGYDVQPPSQLVADWAEDFMAKPETMTDAIELYQLNVRNFPDDPSAYKSLGAAYARAGNKAAAIAAYSKAQALNPKDTDISARLADLQK